MIGTRLLRVVHPSILFDQLLHPNLLRGRIWPFAEVFFWWLFSQTIERGIIFLWTGSALASASSAAGRPRTCH